jgi:small subunit ribosomal protein S8
MSVNDPIGDMLTRIRNALAMSRADVSMPASQQKLAIAKVLKDEGYILDFSESEDGVKRTLTIALKYYQGKPVIQGIKRVSSPGRRTYQGTSNLPKVHGGLGIAIISTPVGVMTDRAARAAGHGGEVLCTVN